MIRLFTLDFFPLVQKRHDVDQLLNRQEMIVFAHCSSPLFHRVTWGCHVRMRFNYRFSKDTNNSNPQTNFPWAIVPVVCERENNHTVKKHNSETTLLG